MISNIKNKMIFFLNLKIGLIKIKNDCGGNSRQCNSRHFN